MQAVLNVHEFCKKNFDDYTMFTLSSLVDGHPIAFHFGPGYSFPLTFATFSEKEALDEIFHYRDYFLSKINKCVLEKKRLDAIYDSLILSKL